VQNSLLAARIGELNLQTRYLQQDQKKVGPNLKDVKLKLRKEWVPVWLRDPQAFRPGTKMPTFWRFHLTAKRAKKRGRRRCRLSVAEQFWRQGSCAIKR
jgi:cbb3-type cytochrome oxidase cytochrome c subunit